MWDLDRFFFFYGLVSIHMHSCLVCCWLMEFLFTLIAFERVLQDTYVRRWNKKISNISSPGQTRTKVAKSSKSLRVMRAHENLKPNETRGLTI